MRQACCCEGPGREPHPPCAALLSDLGDAGAPAVPPQLRTAEPLPLRSPGQTVRAADEVSGPPACWVGPSGRESPCSPSQTGLPALLLAGLSPQRNVSFCTPNAPWPEGAGSRASSRLAARGSQSPTLEPSGERGPFLGLVSFSFLFWDVFLEMHSSLGTWAWPAPPPSASSRAAPRAGAPRAPGRPSARPAGPAPPRTPRLP